MNTHKTKLHGRCPYAPHWDYYELTVTTDQFIKVEEIEVAANLCRGLEMTQEAMAEQLRMLLPKHAKLCLVGLHANGVLTEVTL